jgi:hypothetical protein
MLSFGARFKVEAAFTQLKIPSDIMAKIMMPGRAASNQQSPGQRPVIKRVHSEENLQNVRDFTREQKKLFGQSITTIAGAVKKTDVKFPIAGGQLLGFGFTGSVPNGNVKVTVNNEIIIEDVNGAFLDLTNKQFEYFPFSRPLSATDVIKVEVEDSAVKVVFFGVYYI